MRIGMATRAPAANCPHLGMASDPFSRNARASDEHRCYAHLVRERIDLAHQKRFCLTSAHGTCPFLLVNVREVERDWLSEARTWWRTVSPARQALTAAQFGRWAGLGHAAARTGGVVLQTWRSVRPHQHTAEVEAVASQVEEEPAVVTPNGNVAVHEDVYLHEDVCIHEHVNLHEDVVRHADVTVDETVVVTHYEQPVGVTHYEEPVGVSHDDEPVPAVLRLALPAPHVDAEAAPPTNEDEAREWFWRAKNAETLDDVVKCLERAHASDPDNEMVATNLEWAKERREAQRQAKKGAKNTREPEPNRQSALYSATRRPNIVRRMAAAFVGLIRTSVALAALALGGALILSGLPAKMRDELFATVGAPTDWLPDASGLTSLVHVPLGGGYDLGMAFPYAIGFLALFIGFGLLQRQPSPSVSR